MFVDKFLCEHRFLCLLGAYLGVELLGQMVTSFWRSCQMFSTAAAPFSIPTSSVGGLQFLHIFFSTVFIIANLVVVKQYLVVVFNFIFQMTNDV